MFKFLHTADLHLGKIFHEQSLREDQAVMLDELASVLEKGSYAALVIAGDVYDRSIPSPEAVDLFSSFLERVKNINPSPEVLVIPGNHDSAARLGFGKELFSRLGLYFGVSAEDCDKPVILEQNGEKCAFFLLPFLNSGDLNGQDKEDANKFIPLRSQAALAEEAAGRMEMARKKLCEEGITRSVLVSHIFASGGKDSGSERVFLGQAELVNTSLFKGFDYIAMGHLHRCQQIGENGWYSGSPLSYSFGEVSQAKEAEKFFLSVEFKKGKAHIEKIPVKPLHELASFSGPFARFASDSCDPELEAAKNDYLEINLTDRGLTENAGDMLRRRFPLLLSLRQSEAFAELSSLKGARATLSGNRDRQNISADFKTFLEDLYGKADEDELELFNTLLAEIETGESSS